MTNERAIELLNRISDSQFDGIHGDERREALSMAVRALEQNLVQESDSLVKDLVNDCISRQQAIDAVVSAMIDGADAELVEGVMELLPSAQPGVKEISYTDCANAMLMMWIDKVLTDGEYNRIMDKLNAHEMEKRNGKKKNDLSGRCD